MEPLWINADKRALFRGAKKVDADGNESPMNAATVTCVLKDALGNTVTPAPVTLDKVAGDGNYAGVIDKTVTVLCKPGKKYTVEMTATEAGYDDFRVIQCVALYRGET